MVRPPPVPLTEIPSLVAACELGIDPLPDPRRRIDVLIVAIPDSLPDLEILEALKGYTLLRTERNGWIELATDGDVLWIEMEIR